MAVKRVQSDDILLMNKLYIELGTYAAVARVVGFSASTVKRYIVKDFNSEPAEKRERTPFDIELPLAENIYFPNADSEEWMTFCKLTAEEIANCAELQKEITL